ncbi:hypothetical protein SXANM310S_03076 [Streptomyces xanthochromogenes]
MPIADQGRARGAARPAGVADTLRPMTSEPERSTDESTDVREARRAIEEYLRRTGTPARPGGSTGPDGQVDAAGSPETAKDGGRVDDRTAEAVARAAWDAVQDATPPPPDPAAGPAEKTEQSPELAELHRRAVAIAHGLQALGYHLDETLLPGPDMAAG